VQQKYEGRDVEVLSMYAQGPYPHETGFKEHEQPAALEEKMDILRVS
jgi:hypothetical protein